MTMGLLRKFRRDERGATLIEFAFASPVLIAGMIGILQVGQALQIKAEMSHALGEGARFLKVKTTASDAEVRAEIEKSYTGIDKTKADPVEIVHSTTGSVQVRTLTLTYKFDPEFVLFDVDPIEMTATRRVYLQS